MRGETVTAVIVSTEFKRRRKSSDVSPVPASKTDPHCLHKVLKKRKERKRRVRK